MFFARLFVYLHADMKKAIIILTVLLMGTPSFAADFETATEAVKNMGIGWNLGNALEAYIQTETDVNNSNYWGQQGLDSETSWGQQPTKSELLKMMKEAGFGAIRVPVTWFNHMDKDGNVNAEWMARVHEVVDYVISQGMYCILNVHHDTGADKDNFKSWIKADDTNYTNNKSRFEKLWQQIAEEFKDYDEHLLFESYNEMLDIKNSWCFASFNTSSQYDATIATSAYSAINKYAQSFVDVVRGSGGNNSQRNLIVNTYGACCGSGSWNTHLKDPLSQMKVPTGESNHIIFEVHAYPDIVNKDSNGNITSNRTLASIQSDINEIISNLKTHLVAKGAPVIIGEWGTSNVDAGAGKTDYDARKSLFLSFVDYFVKQCKANNIATFYWMGLSDGIARLLPAFNQPDLALKILQAWYGSDYQPTLPSAGEYYVSATVNYEKQWAELNLFEGSATASQYTGIQLELESTPASDELMFKVYPKATTKNITQASSTLSFTSAMGTITRVTLQWKKTTKASVRVKNIYLIAKDGTKTTCTPNVSWGCTLSDVTVTTDIADITQDRGADTNVYNLQGQRTSKPQKGVYIQNRRKYISR